MSLRVQDAPVARDTDPLTSYEAGENPAAREASEREVLDILAMNGPMTDHDIWLAHEEAALLMREPTYTPQRIRTARAQLVAAKLVVSDGRREGASPTGRAAMAWRLAERHLTVLPDVEAGVLAGLVSETEATMLAADDAATPCVVSP